MTAIEIFRQSTSIPVRRILRVSPPARCRGFFTLLISLALASCHAEGGQIGPRTIEVTCPYAQACTIYDNGAPVSRMQFAFPAIAPSDEQDTEASEQTPRVRDRGDPDAALPLILLDCGGSQYAAETALEYRRCAHIDDSGQVLAISNFAIKGAQTRGASSLHVTVHRPA